MRRFGSPLLVVVGGLLLAGFSPLATKTYRLRLSPEARHIYSLRTKVKVAAQASQDAKAVEKTGAFSFDVKAEVLALQPDGSFTLRFTKQELESSVDGEEVPTNEPVIETVEYDKNGNRIGEPEDKSEDTALDVALAYEPEKPVKVGEKYTPKKDDPADADRLEWEIVSQEDLDGRQVLHLSAHGMGPNDETIASDLYVDPQSFWIRKGILKIKGYPASDNVKATTTVTLTGTDEFSGKG